MSDRLSLPNLISQLQMTHNDDTIVSLCREVESLRRRRYYKKAIEVAQNAVELARPSHVHNAIGASLLYLALARLSSQSPDEIERATQDCDQAILRFNLEPHNSAFAQIFRAEIDQLKNLSAQSVTHLQEAAKAFDELTKNNLAHGDVERAHQYQDWRSAIQAVIVERSGKIADLERVPVSKKQKRRRTYKREHASASTQREPPIGLDIPTELLWPIPEPLELASMLPDQSHIISQSSHDFIEVDSLTINGKSYSVQPINNGARLKTRRDQLFIPIPIKSNIHSERLVLVRPEMESAFTDQIVVAMHPRRERVWLDWYPEAIIIGGIGTDGRVHIDLQDEERPEVQVLGIVDAILTPMTDVIAQINDALDCLDALQYAEAKTSAEVAQGLALIREKLQKHFAKYYGLERIPTVVGETMFDSQKGHAAFGTESQPDLPQDKILKIVLDGYTYQGKVVRDAKVIVNQ